MLAESAILQWDATTAAVSHAALAGVLAALVLPTLLVVLSPPLDVAKAGSRGDVIRLLIFSFTTLVPSAIVWGALAGFDARMSGASSMPIDLDALAGVILLATGALSLLGAFAAMIIWANEADVWDTIRRAYAGFAALASYQIVVFLVDATRTLLNNSGRSLPSWIDLLGPAPATAIGIWTLVRMRRRGQGRQIRGPRRQAARALAGARRSGLVSVGGALLGFSIVSATPGLGGSDHLPLYWIAMASLGVAAMAALLYFALLGPTLSQHAQLDRTSRSRGPDHGLVSKPDPA